MERSGDLDEEGEQQFSFSFRGLTDDSAFFGRTDEYWMNYSSRSLGILMGISPTAFPLTIYSSYGRGFGVISSPWPENMSAGLFYVRTGPGKRTG